MSGGEMRKINGGERSHVGQKTAALGPSALVERPPGVPLLPSGAVVCSPRGPDHRRRQRRHAAACKRRRRRERQQRGGGVVASDPQESRFVDERVRPVERVDVRQGPRPRRVHLDHQKQARPREERRCSTGAETRTHHVSAHQTQSNTCNSTSRRPPLDGRIRTGSRGHVVGDFREVGRRPQEIRKDKPEKHEEQDREELHVVDGEVARDRHRGAAHEPPGMRSRRGKHSVRKHIRGSVLFRESFSSPAAGERPV